MTLNTSFGKALFNQRVSQGLTRETVARNLHIRPDVIKAIENEDFSTMPPEGYAKKMIETYAHYLHMNEVEVVRNYEEAFRNEARLLNSEAADQARMRSARHASYRDSSARLTSPSTTGSMHLQLPSLGTPLTGDGARRSSRRVDYNHSIYADQNKRGFGGSMRASFPQSNSRGSWGVSRGGSNGGGGIGSKLPFVLIAIILVLLLIIAVNAISGASKSRTSEQIAAVPITGLTDPGDENQGEIPEPIKIAPTASSFTYEVADGYSCYIEVYLDGSSSPDVADVIDGPSYKTYDVSGTLSFVCTNPNAITLIVDGKEVSPTDDNGDGVYVYDLNFDDVLAQWKAENEVSSE